MPLPEALALAAALAGPVPAPAAPPEPAAVSLERSAPASSAAAEVPLECRPEIIAAFKEAWLRSGSGRRPYEAAFRVDPRADGLEIVWMDMTYQELKLPVTYLRGRTLAIAHTHPDISIPEPGPGDYAPAVPNFVVSRRALFVTVPGTRTHRLVRRNWREPCDS